MLKEVKCGMSGVAVTIAKYLTGYSSRNEASNEFDKAFSEYICEWQESHGLDPDGVIGDKMWAAIVQTAPLCSVSRNRISAAACAIQILIGGIEADGIYGPKTKAAVAAFQSANRLAVDGITGINTWTALILGDSEPTEPDEPPAHKPGTVINTCVHYLQWDPKWANVRYSTHTNKQTIGNSGCGPSSMAMIMATFVDPAITPVGMASLAVKGGFRTYDSGTDWAFFKYVFNKFTEFGKYIHTASVATLKAALADGALAVCSMNGNDEHFWTTQGHYIVAIGFDDAGNIYANDPNSKTVPRKQQEKKFEVCMKQAFIFWPKKAGV